MTFPNRMSGSGGRFGSVQALPSINPDLLRHFSNFTPPRQARHVVSDGILFLFAARKLIKDE